MKKIILLIILLMPFKVMALADNAASHVLMEFETGKIISDANSNKRLAPASMTKMMSLLIIMERLESGSLKLTDDVLVSANASNMGGSQAYLESNATYKVDELLKAISIASANDAVVALAEKIAGSEKEFVNLMNKKAKTLGLKNTNFKNVHGLDEENHYSSALDMALIARELVRHSLILKYSSIYEDYIKHPSGTSTWIVNTNKLINYYKGLDGLKTGYTESALYCLTATAKKGDMRLISVVMGESDNNIRNQDTMELLNYGFSNYKIKKIVNKNADLGKIYIKNSQDEYYKLSLKENASLLVNVVDENKYSYEIVKNKVMVPLKKNKVVGKVNIYSGENKVKEYDLIVNKEVKKGTFFNYFIRNIKSFISGV